MLVCALFDSLWSWVQWKCHQTLSQILYDEAPGEKVPIPPYDETEHPLVVFHDARVEVNIYRWVVFVLWLQSYPDAWLWYKKVQKTYPSSIHTIYRLVMTLWHQREKRRTKSQSPRPS